MSEEIKKAPEELKEVLGDNSTCNCVEEDLEDDLEEVDLGDGDLLRVPKTLPPVGSFVVIISLGGLLDITGRVCSKNYNPPVSMQVRTWDAITNNFRIVTIFRTQIQRWRRFKSC
jgi:hypothetical protein